MVNWVIYQGQSADWDNNIAVLSGNFYQTYGWGEVRRVSGWMPLRLLAKQDDKVVALASVMVKSRFGVSVCWVPGGPVGKCEFFGKYFFEALRQYLGAQFIYCRISILRESQTSEDRILSSMGWSRPTMPMSSGLTMIYQLSGNEEERMYRTSGNWRHNLKRSQRYNLSVEHWQKPDFYAIASLYREMETIKSLPVQHTDAELSLILHECDHQLIIYRCLDATGKLLAIRAAGVCGLYAIDLLAAAGKEARKVYASHATLWALLSHCSSLGLQKYDLSGVDPIRNKGVYDFKHGTGAKITICLGEWEWASFPGMRYIVNRLIARKNT